ncbi:unnamed protein product [Bursaphelenchus okinawaensis]|uniref:Uncharacterized protein n=1 Tax=Bursaphelenchus okinawaensis TaxID=465554 RepID=A0A811K321_9BILA|nr:unnamed protein product [Bursaphelenchus okinawaensis]CAG9090274.1 unnamed protein product [Bursaphelenchus okinawaensis]
MKAILIVFCFMLAGLVIGDDVKYTLYVDGSAVQFGELMTVGTYGRIIKDHGLNNDEKAVNENAMLYVIDNKRMLTMYETVFPLKAPAGKSFTFKRFKTSESNLRNFIVSEVLKDGRVCARFKDLHSDGEVLYQCGI